MKLPSVQLLLASLLQVVKRFPFVLLSALTGTAALIAIIELRHHNENETLLTKLIMVSSLGLPLFFAVHIFCERMRLNLTVKFVALVTALFVLVQFYFSLRSWSIENGPIFYRFFFWSAGLHLVAAFSAFFTEGDLNGFWQFNKQLFLRFLTAALYSGVLYLGLAGAILAVAELFNVNMHGEIYADLWVLIAGLFNTIFFLGGIEEPVDDLQQQTAYPKGLKIFTQYVLLPLVTIYLLILYAYTVKIAVQMNLPKGWVANLILGFSVTGILSLLLVWPLREQEDNKWIKTFTRLYYFSLVPLVALLLLAIGTRISAYGVTIERYIVAMLGVWLAVITLYFVFSKTKNIILIPLTLSLFLFGSCFGPWGMFKVSERSQLKRLRNILEKNHAFANGKLVRLNEGQLDQIKIKDVQEINSILEYLSKDHGFAGMRDWLSADCQKEIFNDSLNRYAYEKETAVQQCIGIYGNTVIKDQSEIPLHFYCNENKLLNGLDITGYNRINKFNTHSDENYDDNDYSDGGNVDGDDDVSGESYTTLSNNTMFFYIKKQVQFKLPLEYIARKLKTGYARSQQDPSRMTFEVTDASGNKVKLLFTEINMDVRDTSLNVTSVSGMLLLKNQK